MTNFTTLARAASAAAGILLAATLAGGSALAAPAPPPPAKPAQGVPMPKILVINRSAILSNSKVAQDIVRQIQGFSAAAEKEFKAEGEGLKRDEQTLQQQVAILAPNVKAQKIKEFQGRYVAFQQKVQMRRSQIQYGVFKARQQIEQAVGPILQQLMTERGANLLLDRQMIVMGTLTNIDITQDAINRLDQKMPTVKVQLTNPPPEFLRAQQQQQQQGQ